MFAVLGAAAVGAADLLSNLLSKAASSTQQTPGGTGTAANSFNVLTPSDATTSSTATAGVAPTTATAAASSTQGLLSSSTFNALLDVNGDGSVNFSDLKSALQGGQRGDGARANHAHHGGHGGGGGGLFNALSQSVDGTSSATTTNADGTTTTTLTYADGSKVSTTSSAASTGDSSNATSSYNLIEKLIQAQSSAVNKASSTSISV